jgi:hypothetical protein
MNIKLLAKIQRQKFSIAYQLLTIFLHSSVFAQSLLCEVYVNFLARDLRVNSDRLQDNLDRYFFKFASLFAE